mmetsp:Transcript_41980/g.75361  ORF Transcript_41980/g.75361 Transcript_41980/m.75361 type:complete len:314 (-) Transcript_41980:473-1414(-)
MRTKAVPSFICFFLFFLYIFLQSTTPNTSPALLPDLLHRLHVVHRRRVHLLRRGRRVPEVEQKCLRHLLGQLAVRVGGEVEAVGEVVPPSVHRRQVRQLNGQLPLPHMIHIRHLLAGAGHRHLDDGQVWGVERGAEGAEKALGLFPVGGRALNCVCIRLSLKPQQTAQSTVGPFSEGGKGAVDHVGEQLAAVLPKVNARPANGARDEPDSVCVAHVSELIGKRQSWTDPAHFGGVNVDVQRLLGVLPLSGSVKLEDLAGSWLARGRQHSVPCLACLGLNDTAPPGHVALTAQNENVQRLRVHRRFARSLRESR